MGASYYRHLLRPALAHTLLLWYRLNRSPRLLRLSRRLDPGSSALNLAQLESSCDIQRLNRYALWPQFVRSLGAEHFDWLDAHFSHSQSQLFQDLFVLQTLNFKREGYFVEIGVGDGKYLSNTWLLEKEFGWAGILAEPNRSQASSIRASRSALLETRAVWHESDCVLEFLEDEAIPELSTLEQFQATDRHQRIGCSYSVPTVCPNAMLDACQAPERIDYMSIDTEGSELEILKALDFDRYQVAIITIEHNHVQTKLQGIRQILESLGYQQIHRRFSRFDAWFVRPELLID